ncbi:hypothetical protein SAMN05443633_102345 [Chryseobacterium arachidis]|uniref:Uncharacterized protein n=2 Tax=Chryseobacterium arachidis TaxID=1416778 RepID=A0A1M4XJV2_9FLAO|nr:hypothetical protein [Chryseobacterium arachidis]SHE93472.1 hypothetical protein SAMN05443633_102345 [Chryseobacterium arachidis]
MNLLAVFLYNAQVGINTNTPVNMLDINGDLNVRKELRIGGTNTVKGSAGAAGTIFHNTTGLNVNDWKDIKVADGLTSMSLFSMNTLEDKTGVSFSGSDGATLPYDEGGNITSSWGVLQGTSSTFSITNATNKVTFNFQTLAQKTGNGDASTSFACGIFVDDKLRAVRVDVITEGAGSYKIFNLNATLTNLTPKNNYTVKAACIKRNINSNSLGIGRAVDTSILTPDMAKSVLTLSVLQPY